jgi:hypothetical protein
MEIEEDQKMEKQGATWSKHGGVLAAHGIVGGMWMWMCEAGATYCSRHTDSLIRRTSKL